MTMTVMNNSCSCEGFDRNAIAGIGPRLPLTNVPLSNPNHHLTDDLTGELASGLISNIALEQQFWRSEEAQWMQVALQMALKGSVLGEVPVGAILVHEGKIIGQGFNQPITQSDPTCHAEIVALRAACQSIENYRLPLGTTLYVTLEPCTMCIGALIHARLNRLVFATREPRAGMLGSQLDLSAQDFYNHKIQVHGGLLAEQSSQMLKAFFKQRRARKN